MAIGMGLHGEPGLSEGSLCNADSLASLLVERLLDERPLDVTAAEQRVVVLLNGLDGFKCEELFVLFASISDSLKQAGVTVADCECGELVTSLDMAGVSLSLFWLMRSWNRSGGPQPTAPLTDVGWMPRSQRPFRAPARAQSADSLPQKLHKPSPAPPNQPN